MLYGERSYKVIHTIKINVEIGWELGNGLAMKNFVEWNFRILSPFTFDETRKRNYLSDNVVFEWIGFSKLIISLHGSSYRSFQNNEMIDFKTKTVIKNKQEVK